MLTYMRSHSSTTLDTQHRGSRSGLAARPRSSVEECVDGDRVAIAEELGAPRSLCRLADGVGGALKGMEAAQKTPIRLVRPRNLPCATPAGLPQLIETPVIPGPRERVSGHRIVGKQRVLGECSPHRAVCREPSCDSPRWLDG